MVSNRSLAAQKTGGSMPVARARAKYDHRVLIVTLGLTATTISGGTIATSAAWAQTAEQFYSRRSVNLLIGFEPGGGYDLYARLAARHIGVHLPGKPNVVPQNLPGAGALSMMNRLYQTSPKDGSAVGLGHSNIALGQILGGANIEYDARKFSWIGRLQATLDIHYTWHTSPTRTFADTKLRETLVAGTGPSSYSTVYARVLNELVGTRFRIISGFKGTKDSNLAMERGEVEMVLTPWEIVKAANADWVRDKKINILVQYSLSRNADLPDVPTVIEVMESNEQRQIMRLFVSASEIGRSLMMPPDVPKERVEAMRRAYDGMIKDPAFLADVAKGQMQIDPLSGADLQTMIMETFEMTPALVAKAKVLYERR
jgi:tripartite-type tricarboxylate transporter receptor subunit TctC